MAQAKSKDEPLSLRIFAGMKLRNLRHLQEAEIQAFLASSGEKPFRARQIHEWIWQKSARDIGDMTNLSKPLRQLLEENFTLGAVTVDHSQVSRDRTIKNAFRLHDGPVVEGVLIPTDSRMTACVSSQVGCSLTCKFCATGKLDRVRNLDFDEIYDQVAIIREQALAHYGIPLSNIVYMGM